MGEEGRLWEGIMASWVGAQGPKKQATLGTRLQAASTDSQRHNGLLVKPRAGALGGSGGGEARQEDREAGQEQACSLLTTPLGLCVPG